MIFPLAEILRLEKFRQAHNLRSASSGIGNPAQGLLEILFRLRTAGHLHQGHAKFLRGTRHYLSEQIWQEGASYQPSFRVISENARARVSLRYRQPVVSGARPHPATA
jgi:hypothetical protein